MHRWRIERGTPWSEIRRPIHCATPFLSHVNHPSGFLLASQYMYITSCFTIRTKNKQKKQQSRVLLAPVAGTIWFMSDMVGNRGFSCVGLMLGWANIHASATCIIAFFVCCSIGSAPHYHTFDTPSNAHLLLITEIVGKQHGGLCFKVLTH